MCYVYVLLEQNRMEKGYHASVTSFAALRLTSDENDLVHLVVFVFMAASDG